MFVAFFQCTVKLLPANSTGWVGGEEGGELELEHHDANLSAAFIS